MSNLASGPPKDGISFYGDDLPLEGDEHYKDLYLTVLCRKTEIRIILVDNESAINVCVLRTAKTLIFSNQHFVRSTQGVCVYYNTRRQVMGTITYSTSYNQPDRTKGLLPSAQYCTQFTPLLRIIELSWIIFVMLLPFHKIIHFRMMCRFKCTTLTIYIFSYVL